MPRQYPAGEAKGREKEMSLPISLAFWPSAISTHFQEQPTAGNTVNSGPGGVIQELFAPDYYSVSSKAAWQLMLQCACLI